MPIVAVSTISITIPKVMMCSIVFVLVFVCWAVAKKELFLIIMFVSGNICRSLTCSFSLILFLKSVLIAGW